ncbi:MULTISPECIES: hypothetical protein [Lysinibacillus]|nr:hypothetical protein [Lysinibacillus capsici]MCT1542030.1 hypothetical protein [Lysinibacillus capsici]MCT1573261.1 hypothetical protein [Lysinibacillus capsici]MCT1650272.1 hypothetical protein [Lysinibacillus capsici]MCT1728657.1 hypothetical protein [Lysinibacillus capsici]MCT1786512.1 hypothetical protein [Lysinibacillus capsici]
MKLTEKVEAVIKAAQAAKDGVSDISRMGLGVAEKLGEYYDNHLAK